MKTDAEKKAFLSKSLVAMERRVARLQTKHAEMSKALAPVTRELEKLSGRLDALRRFVAEASWLAGDDLSRKMLEFGPALGLNGGNGVVRKNQKTRREESEKDSDRIERCTVRGHQAVQEGSNGAVDRAAIEGGPCGPTDRPRNGC